MNDATPAVVAKNLTSEQISGVISVLRVKPSDRIIFTVEVGRMSPPRVKEYLEEIKKHVKEFLPEGVKLAFTTMVDGKPSCDITVLRYEEE